MAGAIQCYSCKATASNEIEANIRCLESANLEDCSDFYEYYKSVQTVISNLTPNTNTHETKTAWCDRNINI